jgi:hypothetical protein
MDEYVVLWENPYGAQRHEQEWFECLEDAQKAIEGWKVKFPWNTYRLAKVIAVHEASAERANPYGVITYSSTEDINFTVGS